MPAVRLTPSLYALACLGCAAALVPATPASAQRAGENTATRAEDGFGTSIGGEQIGIYGPGFVRGFSAIEAGNIRIDGLAIDQQAPFNDRLVAGLQMRVGLSAQSYPFPAPTGVADYTLRRHGERRLLSIVARVGPLGGSAVELDAQLPLSTGFGLAGGLSIAGERTHFGGTPVQVQGALIGRWSAGPDRELVPFFSVTRQTSEEAQPLFATDGTTLPPSVPRATLLGQDWAESEATFLNTGLLGRWRTGGWTVRAGLFGSQQRFDRAAVQLFVGADPVSGLATEVVLTEQDRDFGSLSGELRVTRRFATDRRLHQVHATVRGRARDRTYGGADVTVVGSHRIDTPLPVPEPAYAFGPQTRDRVRQVTLGLAYEGLWPGVGEISLGVQRTFYRKTVTAPLGPLPASTASPWLINATAAVHLSASLALYASHTEGLEESPVAPETAINRDQAFPAIQTRQSDAGLRWTIRPGVRFVTGLFSVEKPFFALDSAGVFRRRGLVRQSGLELSFLGQISPQLLVVAGTTWKDPRVIGAEDAGSGLATDARPVGSFRRLTNLVVQHRPGWLPGTAVDVIVESSSDRVASNDARVLIPARTTISVGLRQPLRIAERPASIRVLLANVTEVRGFGNTSGGLFVLNQPRRLSVTLAVDW